MDEPIKKYNCEDSEKFENYLKSLSIVSLYLKDNPFLIDTIIDSFKKLKKAKAEDASE